MIAKSVQLKANLEGAVRADPNTKRLLRSIRPGEIALIRHPDLDEAAAEGLLEAGVRAVINASRTMSGTFPHEGPTCLLQAGVPLFEIDEERFGDITNGEIVSLRPEVLTTRLLSIPVRAFTYESMRSSLEAAERNYAATLRDFAANTLHYAACELQQLAKPIPIPPLRVPLWRRDALIVARGKGYKEDLVALSEYITEARPVLIGVDGGADALIAQGIRPDLIIGDMDSVSDAALHCGAQLLVHAYEDGRAPGMERLGQLGLCAERVAAPGTSEDAAMRIAYEQGADHIVVVGSHSHPVDFMEKGRGGMASTLLVRMLIGHKLVDAKGANRWMMPKKHQLHIMPGLVQAVEGGGRL
ncbi:putative cytokinetic ring protein SteA [Paenibacillus oceani]|uniref:Thiamine pyrophosphokinase n=1 Tax=Paenibacillus oceani TaxID=2772510 RepID=A0A927C8Q0_9BACL|nr:putative cytokinetic ring protein SteA [Paenibacillus oceani]MBD2861415.1 thiamine pyrophosphokinase [Paenibacillus oceani]